MFKHTQWVTSFACCASSIIVLVASAFTASVTIFFHLSLVGGSLYSSMMVGNSYIWRSDLTYTTHDADLSVLVACCLRTTSLVIPEARSERRYFSVCIWTICIIWVDPVRIYRAAVAALSGRPRMHLRFVLWNSSSSCMAVFVGIVASRQ